MGVTKPYEFVRLGAMDVTKPYEFIRFGAMDVTKPYEFIGCGAMDVTIRWPGSWRAGWGHGDRYLLSHLLWLGSTSRERWRAETVRYEVGKA